MPLLIKTVLHETLNKGIGIFTKEFIKKDTVIYYDDPAFDRRIPKEIVDKMSPILKEFVTEYASFYEEENIYYLCCDNSRFWNHSEHPNSKYIEWNGTVVALQDIEIGEELTSNYREFCSSCAKGDFGFEVKD